MSVYVNVGGNGSGSGILNANSATTVALCTTPNISNQLYLITVQVHTDEAAVLSYQETGGEDWGYGGIAPNLGHGYNQTMKVGPNQAIEIAISNQSATNCGYNYSYQYVGIIIDTN